MRAVGGRDNEGPRASSQALLRDCLSGFKRTTMLEAKAPIVAAVVKLFCERSSNTNVTSASLHRALLPHHRASRCLRGRSVSAATHAKSIDIVACKVTRARCMRDWSLLGDRPRFGVSCRGAHSFVRAPRSRGYSIQKRGLVSRSEPQCAQRLGRVRQRGARTQTRRRLTPGNAAAAPACPSPRHPPERAHRTGAWPATDPET
jgi:hypothetical protein